jgi:hypothetical protein
MAISLEARQRFRQRMGNIEIADEIINAIESDQDFLSGVNLISENQVLKVLSHQQTINFTELKIDGILILEGDLWLA